MTQKRYTLTLTRWHHVAGRIKALSNSQLAEARDTLGGAAVDNILTDAQVQALKAKGARGLVLLNQGLAGIEAVGKIRGALAEANGKHGVAAMLSDAEDKRARAKALESFAHIDLLASTPVEQANEALRMRSGEKGIGMLRGVRVSLVELDALDFISEQRRGLEAQAAAISDQVAELNRQTLSLDLDESLAKAVGL